MLQAKQHDQEALYANLLSNLASLVCSRGCGRTNFAALPTNSRHQVLRVNSYNTKKGSAILSTEEEAQEAPYQEGALEVIRTAFCLYSSPPASVSPEFITLLATLKHFAALTDPKLQGFLRILPPWNRYGTNGRRFK